MKITLKEMYEYNKKCVIDELEISYGIKEKDSKKYIKEGIPSKEDFLDDFESSLLHPWATIIDYDEDKAKEVATECAKEISNAYDEIVKTREDFIRNESSKLYIYT